MSRGHVSVAFLYISVPSHFLPRSLALNAGSQKIHGKNHSCRRKERVLLELFKRR